MKIGIKLDDYEVGYNIPAAIDMDVSEVHTPCLVLNLDALERNIRKMGDIATHFSVRHRARAGKVCRHGR